MELFRTILHAAFLARPNRFVVGCLVDGRKLTAEDRVPGFESAEIVKMDYGVGHGNLVKVEL